MEYRQLGRSGFKVPVLSYGTGTFGGSNAFFERWGNTDVAEARKLIDICLDAASPCSTRPTFTRAARRRRFWARRSRASAIRL
jgi:hypothetical protein